MTKTIATFTALATPIATHARGGLSSNPDGLQMLLAIAALMFFMWLGKEDPALLGKLVIGAFGLLILLSWLKR